ATLIGPQGPIETCVLHPGSVPAGTAQSILAGDNAVLVIPRVELPDGSYSVTVNSDGGNTAWSFGVDRNAPLTPVAAAPASPAPTPIETTLPIGEPVSFLPQAP